MYRATSLKLRDGYWKYLVAEYVGIVLIYVALGILGINLIEVIIKAPRTALLFFVLIIPATMLIGISNYNRGLRDGSTNS